MAEIRAQRGSPETGHSWAEVTEIGPPESRDKPLHEHWTDALEAAAFELGVGDGEGWFNVRTTVYIKHGSPGWVDGFQIHMHGGGG